MRTGLVRDHILDWESSSAGKYLEVLSLSPRNQILKKKQNWMWWYGLVILAQGRQNPKALWPGWQAYFGESPCLKIRLMETEEWY